jgi:hypothetical protein
MKTNESNDNEKVSQKVPQQQEQAGPPEEERKRKRGECESSILNLRLSVGCLNIRTPKRAGDEQSVSERARTGAAES